MGWWSYRPYVSVAARQAKASREVQKLAKKGRVITPVKIEGRKIATTFWGCAWCDHLEHYSDFASRLPRGRTYIRNGSVVDLQIAPGKVTSLVSGSELYTVEITITPAVADKWQAIRQACAGKVSSVIELLKGRISEQVMSVVTGSSSGLFPTPSEIKMKCSCPDWADMCKHVAATLYGVGARLDTKPELLFLLRNVDHLELVSQAAEVAQLATKQTDARIIADAELSDVFGIDLGESSAPAPEKPARRGASPAKVKPAAKKATGKSVKVIKKAGGKKDTAKAVKSKAGRKRLDHPPF